MRAHVILTDMFEIVMRALQGMGAWMYGMDGIVRIGMVFVQCALCGAFFAHMIPQRRFVHSLRVLFWTVVAWLVLEVVAWGSAQYAPWVPGSVSHHFAPLAGFGYFAGYVWVHSVKAIVLGGLLGVGFFFVFALGNDLSHSRFFYEDEEYNAGIALLAIPWPQSLLVLPGVLMMGLLVSVVRVVLARIKGKHMRVLTLNMRACWPVVSVVMLIFGAFLAQAFSLSVLRA